MLQKLIDSYKINFSNKMICIDWIRISITPKVKH